MAYRIKESKFPLMEEQYRVFMIGATEEMLQDENVINELASLDLKPEDVEYVADPEEKVINN